MVISAQRLVSVLRPLNTVLIMAEFNTAGDGLIPLNALLSTDVFVKRNILRPMVRFFGNTNMFSIQTADLLKVLELTASSSIYLKEGVMNTIQQEN